MFYLSQRGAILYRLLAPCRCRWLRRVLASRQFLVLCLLRPYSVRGSCTRQCLLRPLIQTTPPPLIRLFRLLMSLFTLRSSKFPYIVTNSLRYTLASSRTHSALIVTHTYIPASRP
ncbi:hypothetical protein K523DRAFT_115839 [Schizophyllum commune Tattone D]|nr:hypothetical protein K523DRAFT_115839 [Schizophyllum commune Tattone D]